MDELAKNKYRKVLIIDDDDDDCALIAETLHEIDNQIKCVIRTDGKAGLSYVIESEKKPEIIFLDLHMPKMNGQDVLKVLKSVPELSHIPVIICTDSKLVREMEECKNLGAVDFIVKPSSFFLIKFEIRKAMKAVSDMLIS